MNKLVLAVNLFLCTTLGYSNNDLENQITLPKENKVSTTFSGDLTNNKSFHLIFTKNINAKNYELFSYLFDGKNVLKMPLISGNEEYNVISFHHTNGILTVLFKYKEKRKQYLKRINFNLNTLKKEEFEAVEHNDFLTSIRAKDRSILVYKSDDLFTVTSYNGDQEALNKTIDFKQNEDVKKFFKGQSVAAVKTDEFVANGATNVLKVYCENNVLFFTRDSEDPINLSIAGISLNNKRINTTELLKLDLKEALLSPVLLTFDNGKGEKFKKATSFFLNNKLFQLALSKDIGYIHVADATSGKSLNTISLDETLNSYIKGNPAFQGLEKFLNNAGKNKYNATITANATTTNKVRVRVDYVDLTYNYSYNYWWHHHQFMWQQHHEMFIKNSFRNVPTGFGPGFMDDATFENATIKKEKRFFELLIDGNGSIVNEALPQTIFKEIDKKELIDTLDRQKGIDFESSCFLENSFRYIMYSKELEIFEINSKQL